MAEILFVKRPPLKEFYWRRFSRVYPALLVFVLTSALLFSGTWMHVGPLPVLSSLTFTLNYAMMFAKRVAMLEHIWSLCVEEHAYILLGALAVAFRKMVQVPLVLLSVGLFCMANGILLTEAQGKEFSENNWTVYARSDVAMAPIFLAAALFLIFRDHKSQNMKWASPACLFAGLICKLDSVPDLLQHSMGTFLLAMSMATLHLSVAPLRYALALAPMRILGAWSYSLYLWQQPFYKLQQHPNDFMSPAWTTICMLVASLCFGLLSFYWVETPCRTKLNKWIDR